MRIQSPMKYIPFVIPILKYFGTFLVLGRNGCIRNSWNFLILSPPMCIGSTIGGTFRENKKSKLGYEGSNYDIDGYLKVR
jgi:hypothetical protein